MGEIRFNNIDRAAGIAIILVVFGHMHFQLMMEEKWYLVIREFIYKIHMSLFIFLSGFVAFLSAKKTEIRTSKEYLNFIRKKANKFIPVYLFFGFLAITIDLFFYHKTFQEILPALKAMVLYPAKGSATFIWYLYVLFGFYLVTPLLLRFRFSILTLVLAGSFLLTFIPLTPLFSANLFGKYFFFFLGGGLFYLNYDTILAILRKYGWIFLFLFTIATVVDFTAYPLSLQLLSILFIPGILFLTSLKWNTIISDSISQIGQGSFAIYLMGSIVLNTLYLIFTKSVHPFNAIIFALTGLITGVLIPLLIRYGFNKMVPKNIYVL